MAAFEDEQIEQFIKNWFQKERDAETNTAERCWELLNSPDYQAAKELAQTPLLLTLLCVVYDEFQDFPKKRHALYGEALDVLLRKWASEKRIQRNPIYQELSAELELDMLAEIAYTSFVDDQLFFSKDRLINQIREFLVNNLNAPDHLDAETVLREIEIQQGVLVERARDTYSFSHLTFQEYLTAKYIVDNQKIDQMVRDHVTSQQWREIFLLAAGLAPGKSGANRLLLLIESHAKPYLTNRKIQELIRWTSAISRSECDVSSSALQRALAILLIRSCDVIGDEDLALARDLSKILNLDQTEYLFSDLNLTLKVAISLVKALDRKLYYNLCFVLMNSLSSKDLSGTRLFVHVQTYLKFGILRKNKLEKLLNDLSKIKSPIIEDNYSSQSVHDSYKEYLHKLRLCVARNLNIDLDVISLSYQESHFLVLYLSLLELMVSCKEAAVRVSPHVWTGIESRMVTVPAE